MTRTDGAEQHDAEVTGEPQTFVFDDQTEPDPRSVWFEIVIDPAPTAGEDDHCSLDTECEPLPSDLY